MLDVLCTTFYAIILQYLIACNLQAELEKCRFGSAGFSEATPFQNRDQVSRYASIISSKYTATSVNLFLTRV